MYDQPVKFSEVNIFGASPRQDDVYTVEGFFGLCKDGSFVDDDGYGYPVKNGLADNSIRIKPSYCNIPNDATHVVWYNA